jgi:hypothetical protein
MYQGMSRSPRLRVELVAAIALAIGSMLPFAYWSFGGSLLASISVSFSLDEYIRQGDLASMLVLAGGGIALGASIYRIWTPWPQSGSAAVCLLGFVAFTAGVLLVLSWSPLGDYSGLGFSTSLSPGFGFWFELAAGAFGAIVCFANLISPVRAPAGQGAWAPGGPPSWSSYPPAPYTPPPFAPAPQWQANPAPYYGGAPSYRQAGDAAANPAFPARPPAQPPAVPGVAVLTVLFGGQAFNYPVTVGRTLSIGRDAGADINLADTRVSPRQLEVTLTPAGWTVRSLDVMNPAHLLDPSGSPQPLRDEVTLASGQVFVGSTALMLGALPGA